LKVPFIDLKLQDKEIRKKINSSINEVINTTQFSSGKFVEDFEADFAKFCNTKFCVGVSSGTSALHLALIAHGIGPGDEVITVPNSFISTAWAISYVGATPIFVDVDTDTFLIDHSKIEDCITKNTKAIIPVHLYGQPADMDRINKVANDYNLIVIEDGAQSHASKYKDSCIGSLGNSVCYSFYPGKNLGAYGEAGAITTDNELVYNKLISLRNHGQSERYKHDMIGYNYRMDGIQGAVLKVKLKELNNWTKRRNDISRQYDKAFGEFNQLQSVKIKSYNYSARHLYVLHYENRYDLINYLNENEIQTGIHYPFPIHLQKAYNFLNHKLGDFPIAEKNANTCLSLPLYYGLENNKVFYVIDVIREYFNK